MIICTKHELQCHFFLEITIISWHFSLEQEENICVRALTVFHILAAHTLPRAAGAGLLAAALYLLRPGGPGTGKAAAGLVRRHRSEGKAGLRGLHRVLLTQAPCHQCNAI